MKNLIICVIISLQSGVVWGQRSFYESVKLENFKVGYADTTIYDQKFRYEAFGYAGMKPYFLQIWHPYRQSKADSLLILDDLLLTNSQAEPQTIQKQLTKNGKEIIIRDFISENFKTGETNDFGQYTVEDVYDAIGKIKTRSSRKNMPAQSNYPVIIYHHGSQSQGAENYAMAEYFASRGFIFIASNFHLPYENSLFGLKPYDKIIRQESEESLKTVLAFVKSISHNPAIFFVGHSWGAQMGFRTFDFDSNIKGFVSLETTIEFKNDSAKIKELWAEVYQKIAVEKVSYPFPILLCASTGKKEVFPFFAQVKAPRLVFAPTNKQFEHNAYLSLFYVRYFLDKKLQQSDEIILKDRLALYVKHLNLMFDFFNSILNQTKEPKQEIKYVQD